MTHTTHPNAKYIPTKLSFSYKTSNIFVYMFVNENSNECSPGTRCLFNQSQVIIHSSFISSTAKTVTNYPDFEPGDEFWKQVWVSGSCYKSLIQMSTDDDCDINSTQVYWNTVAGWLKEVQQIKTNKTIKHGAIYHKTEVASWGFALLIFYLYDW